jgi:hypothetical protein
MHLGNLPAGCTAFWPPGGEGFQSVGWIGWMARCVPHGPFFGRFWTFLPVRSVCVRARKWPRIAPLAFRRGNRKNKMWFGRDVAGLIPGLETPRLAGPRHGEHCRSCSVRSDPGNRGHFPSCCCILGSELSGRCMSAGNRRAPMLMTSARG